MIVLCGPTASGKSTYAIELAKERNGEVVGADAVQIYRDLIIGSAAPTAEERGDIPHHLIGILDLPEDINAGRFIKLARPVVEDIIARGRVPILVGGTNFYVDAFLNGLSPVPELDEEKKEFFAARCVDRPTAELFAELQQVDPRWAAAISSPNDRQRILRGLEVFHLTGTPLSLWNERPREQGWSGQYKKIALAVDRETLNERIVARTRKMLAGGLLDEVSAIRAKGFTPANCRVLGSIGYREAFDHLDGRIATRVEFEELIVIHTRQLAKRQTTWLKNDPAIEWISAADTTKII
ncbi:MAG TPA: tRNA (adenosine(37)-N6)-dimethylallyltransferase MiaA [bacterium]|nr:tRNA (adenosine(37)-N6)-dimethylallyltransferase MiaA [bacterium]